MRDVQAQVLHSCKWNGRFSSDSFSERGLLMGFQALFTEGIVRSNRLLYQRLLKGRSCPCGSYPPM